MRALYASLLATALVLGAPPTTSASAAEVSWTDAERRAIDGTSFALDDFAGHVVLVVNVASFCHYTPQYTDLEALWDRYRDRGLVVLGVPCNQFGNQEPGSNREIRNFCNTRYGVTFPMLEKQDVNGEGRSVLYRELVGSKAGGGGDVGWNFEKFLVGRDGTVLGRFPSHVVPQDPSLVAAIELALADG